ncbi:uncharacterized protein RSE6_05117 [Rhynchosporium secalis]|uniref:Uncharacterized protein n=1 Tax=Rhynchosporium secalis TaxID=38038 RepID=A0A1E1M704_RHYSE|nr:uncharacterized protein RSE6_05117 [Rhynchosporium secalis]
MMEVLRATIEAANALNTASELLPAAMSLNTSVKTELQSYEIEVDRSKRLIDVIRSQISLQTSGVVAGIRMIQSHGMILGEDLMRIKQKDGAYLKKTLEMLRTQRMAVTQQVRLATVGLSKSDGTIRVQTRIVESTNKAVKTALGNENGLVFATFLAKLKKAPDTTGEIRLTNREYEKLKALQVKTTHPEMDIVSTDVKTRIICNCLAKDQAIQILGFVASDLWAEIAFVKIEGLIAMDQAIQIAQPVSMEVFLEVLDRQEKRIAVNLPRFAGEFL